MKAQSAIEYLMTYGWMLITVAVIGGSMYSMAGEQCAESTSGFNGEDVEIENYGLSSENKIDLTLENRASNEIEVNSVSVEGVRNETETEIKTGNTESLSVQDFIQSDSCNTLDVEINYDSGSLENLSTKGTLTGQYTSDSIGSPSIRKVTQ